MKLPPKLKDMDLFDEGNSWRGQAVSVTVPKLARKLEGYRGAGMDSEFPIDLGGETLELEFELGGPDRSVFTGFGEVGGPGRYRRFAGAYQSDDTGEVAAIQIICRGVEQEIEMGEQKLGEAGSFKVKSWLTYYQLSWNGEVLVEIDVRAGTYITGGVDRRAAVNAALGR